MLGGRGYPPLLKRFPDVEGRPCRSDPPGVRPNEGELSEGGGGTLGRLTLAQPLTKSDWIGPTQRLLASKRIGNERRCKLVWENEAHCQNEDPLHLGLSVRSLWTAGVNAVVRVTKPRNIL